MPWIIYNKNLNLRMSTERVNIQVTIVFTSFGFEIIHTA